MKTASNSFTTATTALTLSELYAEGAKELERFNIFVRPHTTGARAGFRIFTPKRAPVIDSHPFPVRFLPLQEVHSHSEQQRVEAAIHQMRFDLREFWEPLIRSDAKHSELHKMAERMLAARPASDPLAPQEDPRQTNAALLLRLQEVVPEGHFEHYVVFLEYCLYAEPLADRQLRLELELRRFRSTP